MRPLRKDTSILEVISRLNFRYLIKRPTVLLAFGFGSGLSPVGPGTLGTLVAVPMYLVLTLLPMEWYVAFVGATAFVGVYICGYASSQLGVHDHPGIVWDEFVGFWITMIAAPPDWYWLLAGFIIFRMTDIIKPWPISIADRKIHGGFGIMLDDVLAGVLSLGCMQTAVYFWG